MSGAQHSTKRSPYYGKKVLVVDDSHISRSILKAMIEAICGSIDVYEARDGDEAIRMVRLYHPDLITLDEEMPKRNGLDSVPEILTEHQDSRIVLITCHQEDDVKLRVKELGIEFIAKPITEAKVISMLS